MALPPVLPGPRGTGFSHVLVFDPPVPTLPGTVPPLKASNIHSPFEDETPEPCLVQERTSQEVEMGQGEGRSDGEGPSDCVSPPSYTWWTRHCGAGDEGCGQGGLLSHMGIDLQAAP